ncbi:MAG: biopolymer transporter ExbD [Bacteriovoracaceae bacterium]|nr:biopolymer transporter ExbD [Bacteriovoracaceae bacterium]
MRTTRFIRKRGRRGAGRNFEIDITSLLDILVILVVFLLKSYNSSGIVMNVPKGVELPMSQSQTLNTSGTIVQVSPTKIWVENKIVVDSEKDRKGTIYSEKGRLITPLFDELVSIKNSITQLEKSTHGAKKFSGKINLIVDKTIKYSYVKKLMYSCAEAGYRTYNFVVLGPE